MRAKSVVLLSAGLDSSFNLFRAFEKTEVILALTFNYGQRAAHNETKHAAALASLLRIPHQVIDLKWFENFTKTALVNKTYALPQSTEVEIDSYEASEKTAKAVWVPNRNGIFLNIAAGFAEGLGASLVIPGFNKEEAATFPDNSPAFMSALDKSFEFSTQGRVRVECYSQNLSKTEIVKEGLTLKLPFEKLWPCYESTDNWCGECESCQRFARALTANGIDFAELKKSSR